MSDSGEFSEQSWRRPLDEDELVSEAVVEAVATATGRDAESLPPLIDHVDPEALDDLFACRTASPAAGLVFTLADDIPTDLEVRFEYGGYDVTVSDSCVLLE